MAAPSLAATGSRVELRGYERFMTLSDHSNSKIAHVMALRASDAALVAFIAQLPRAVVQTFNRHPRMRATQVRNVFAVAEIQSAVTLESVATRSLLAVETADFERDTERWEDVAERECAAPLDRFTQFPHYVRAWHYRCDGLVRLLLVSDHYMSDGISGLIVLNDIVTFAAALTQIQTANSTVTSDIDSPTELPLRPSLYDMWLAPHTWWLRLSRWSVTLFGKAVYARAFQQFTPVITPRADQTDFALPLHVNSSSAMFAKGTPANMQHALQRCKDERVTFFGALAACIVISYAIASGYHRDCTIGQQDDDASTDGSTTQSKPEPKKRFTLAADIDFNMRKRIAPPVPEDHVGAYMGISTLESLATNGVDFDATSFWDLARACKRELDAALTDAFMPLQLLFIDANIHSAIRPDFMQDLCVPHAVASDVNISNVGRYPYTLKHAITTQTAVGAANGGSNNSRVAEELRIDSLHVYNSNPHLGPTTIMYVTATEQLNYSMMHKYELDVAQTLFAAYVTSLERIGEIASSETMACVADKVVEAIKVSGHNVHDSTAQSAAA